MKNTTQPGPQIRVRYWKLFFLLLNQTICCGYSKEPSRWDGSFEHPKHMFKLLELLLKQKWTGPIAKNGKVDLAKNELMNSMKQDPLYLGLWLYTDLRIRSFFFSFLNQNICCGCSKEPSRWDGYFEHPKHLSKLLDKKIIPFYTQIYALKIYA